MSFATFHWFKSENDDLRKGLCRSKQNEVLRTAFGSCRTRYYDLNGLMFKPVCLVPGLSSLLFDYLFFLFLKIIRKESFLIQVGKFFIFIFYEKGNFNVKNKNYSLRLRFITLYVIVFLFLFF